MSFLPPSIPGLGGFGGFEFEVLDQSGGDITRVYTGSAVYGPTPVPDAVARCEQVLADSRSNRLVEALAKRSLAALRAMQGRSDEARDLAMDAAGILEDLGLWLRAAFAWETIAFVERLAGDAEATERALRTGYELSEKLGEQGFLSTVSALLAKGMLDRDRLEEAERYLAVSAEAAAEDDLATQVTLRGARGRAWAARGDLAAAETSCREAVALADTTDDLNMRAEALQDLAAVLRLAGRSDDAPRRARRLPRALRRERERGVRRRRPRTDRPGQLAARARAWPFLAAEVALDLGGELVAGGDRLVVIAPAGTPAARRWRGCRPAPRPRRRGRALGGGLIGEAAEREGDAEVVAHRPRAARSWRARTGHPRTEAPGRRSPRWGCRPRSRSSR